MKRFIFWSVGSSEGLEEKLEGVGKLKKSSSNWTQVIIYSVSSSESLKPKKDYLCLSLCVSLTIRSISS